MARPFLETLLEAVRVSLGRGDPGRLRRAIACCDDHQALLTQARAEGLAGLVSLEAQNLFGRMEPFASCFQEEFVRNGVYMSRLEDLDRALHRAGLQAIVLKGAGLILTAYRSTLGVRPLSDLDLLVRPGELARLHRVALELGYQQRLEEPLCYLDDGYGMDLHVDLAGRLDPVFRLCAQACWTRAEPLAAHLPSLLVLSPEDQFLQVAVHGLKHAYHRLIWLVDLARVLGATDPVLLGERALETRTDRVLAYATALLGRLFQQSCPGLSLPHLNAFERRFLEAVIGRGHPVSLGKLVAVFSICGWHRRLFYLVDLCRPQTPGQTWAARARGLLRVAGQLFH